MKFPVRYFLEQDLVFKADSYGCGNGRTNLSLFPQTLFVQRKPDIPILCERIWKVGLPDYSLAGALAGTEALKNILDSSGTTKGVVAYITSRAQTVTFPAFSATTIMLFRLGTRFK